MPSQTNKHQIFFPLLNPNDQYGEILRWLKKNGEIVTAGEDIAEISSSKANIFISSPVTGPIHHLVSEREVVMVGSTIAVIGKAPKLGKRKRATHKPRKSLPLWAALGIRWEGKRLDQGKIKKILATSGFPLAVVHRAEKAGLFLAEPQRRGLEGAVLVFTRSMATLYFPEKKIVQAIAAAKQIQQLR